MISYLKNIYHFCLAWFGDVVYRHPSRELVVIGITGTKGKTTSVELLRAVLQGAGKKTAMLSSVHIAFGEVMTSRSGNTMPGRFFIQKFLRRAVSEGCQYAVVEVTSQGVAQHRHRFINFDIAGITCLHPEHIESHGGYSQYREAKVAFFRDVARYSTKPDKQFFINADMASGGDAQYFEQAVTHPTGKGHFGSIHHYTQQNFLRNELRGDKNRINEWLQSDFNLENAALVFRIAQSLHLPAERVLQTLKTFTGVVGRLEVLRGKNRTVVIDSALTPESLRALYAYLRTLVKPGGKLIAVFGSAGGGRDTWKRPELGKVASTYCEQIYLTNDEPYDEDPGQIISQIKAGITNQEKCVVIADRTEAIRTAIRQAGSADITALTGMGSLPYIHGPRGTSVAWNEQAVVQQALDDLQ